jgi:hypothetical protein
VREEHGGEPAEVGRLVALEPEDLGRGVARQEGQARGPDDGGRSAQGAGEEVALLGRRGVAPELGGPDDLAVAVERHEAVLLAGDADAADAPAVDLGDDRPQHQVEGADPVARMLLHVADGQAGDEPVRRGGRGQDAALVEVEGDGLGALGAGIDAEVDGHGREGLGRGAFRAGHNCFSTLLLDWRIL